MKPLPLLFALSIVANLGLGALVLRRASQPAPVVPAPSAAPVAAAAAEPSKHNGTGTDAVYLTQLREEGFPPKIIRALVMARLYEKYADRFRKVEKSPREHVYWRGNTIFGSDPLSAAERAARRAISKEMEDEARALLGSDAEPSVYQKAVRQRTMGHLSVEAIQQVEAINKDYQELMSQFNERTRGLVLKADREELRLLEREKRADLAAVMTAEELEEYDMRGSGSADSIRSRMTYFDPTEAEFRAVTKLQLQFDQQFGTANLSAEERERRSAAEKELPEKIKAVLGSERFAEFQITSDGNFRGTVSFLRTIDMDVDDAKQVVALQRSIAERATAVRAQADLTPAQRSAALSALADEATNQLTVKLGEKNLAEYRRSPGNWLNQLRPKPAPAGKPNGP